MTSRVIDRFDGAYAAFSNFFPSRMTIDGIPYRWLEPAFQAWKTFDREERLQVAAATRPGLAKKLGGPRQKGGIVSLRHDWEEVKEEVMHLLLLLKFGLHPDLDYLLCQSHPAEIIEGNGWGDDEWGCVWRGGQWCGQNKLGRLLERVRTERLSGAAPLPRDVERQLVDLGTWRGEG